MRIIEDEGIKVTIVLRCVPFPFLCIFFVSLFTEFAEHCKLPYLYSFIISLHVPQSIHRIWELRPFLSGSRIMVIITPL